METTTDPILISVIGAAIAVIFGGLGSSIGVFSPAVKGAGVLAEKPDLFGKILIISALPGSQGVYGLLIGILALAKIGLFAELAAITPSQAWQIFTAGAIMGATGLFTGLLQGKVAAGGIGAAARDGSVAGKAIVLSVIIETYAIFGLLVALLIVNSVQV